MWIVALALRRPYTFVVMALVLIILTPIVILRTPVDIFPDINIPVISVVWNYGGFAPAEMADRIVSNSERGITITVNDIEHIESQSVNGVGVIKIFFRPQANIQTALSQVTAIVQTTVRGLPPGTTPPSGHHLLGVVHSDRAAWFEQQNSSRTATVRSGSEFSAFATGDGARRRDAVPLWRKDPSSPGRSRHTSPSGEWPVSGGYRQRH